MEDKDLLFCERSDIANLIHKNFEFFKELDSAYLPGFFTTASESGQSLTKIMKECQGQFEQFSEQAADLLLLYKSEYTTSLKKSFEYKSEKKRLMDLTGKITTNTEKNSRFSVKVMNLKNIESVLFDYKGERYALKVNQKRTQRFKLKEKPDFLLFAEESLENQENSLKIAVVDILKERLTEFEKQNIEEIVTMTGLEFKVKLKIVISLCLNDKLIFMNERLEELTELIKFEKTKSLLFWETLDFLKLKYSRKSDKFKTNIKALAPERKDCCLIV